MNRSNVPSCFVMVGLPARGKTYMSKKLARYLNWIGYRTKVFNAGEYRRELYGTVNCTADFFDPNNEDGKSARMNCVDLAINDMQEFFKSGGQVGILDATNTTKARRRFVYDRCNSAAIKTFFIESVCDNPDVVYENIIEVKVTCPDYKGVPEEEACTDFLQRIKFYEEEYELMHPDEESKYSFIKIFNCGEKYFVNSIEGYLQSRAVYFLMNTHVNRRAIYLTRHGESMCNQTGRIGGDSDISPRGEKYALALSDFMAKQDIPGLRIWTSTLLRTKQTARHCTFAQNIEQWQALDELDAGTCDNMTYEEIQEKFPEEFAMRDQDKFRYRYPRGESYEDVVTRLEPVIMELERQQNILAICHQAVMRCLLSYFLDTKSQDIPYLKIPLHTVFKLTPLAYGCHVEKFFLDVPCVSTHRDKPGNVKSDRADNEALATVPAHLEANAHEAWHRVPSKAKVYSSNNDINNGTIDKSSWEIQEHDPVKDIQQGKLPSLTSSIESDDDVPVSPKTRKVDVKVNTTNSP